MEKRSKPECIVEAVPEDPSRPDGPTDIYLVFEGRRIAKRGKPGTLHAMTWISLEPGVVVRDVAMSETLDGAGSSRSTACACIDAESITILRWRHDRSNGLAWCP
jgi:hypothetical protein